MRIETRAFARAGLLGNPSDGYFGKTISVALRNFHAATALCPSDELRIERPSEEREVYSSMEDLVERINIQGYYGGDRLIKAAVKKFQEYCREKGVPLAEKNFTLSYWTTIPRQLGMAGSSAIVTAAMRALMRFFDVDIPKEILPGIVLAVETEELGINAGLQDRVVQVYEGCVYMDFNEEYMSKNKRGIYESLSPDLLPELYMAYKSVLGKVSGQVLNDIRVRYDRGDKEVIDTLMRIAGIAEEGKRALREGNRNELHALINENFDLRCRIMNVSESNKEMVRTARACGASAKFAGSGGSIIGTYEGEEMFERLKADLAAIGAEVFKPEIACP